MRAYLTVFIVCSFSTVSYADMTGAGDAAILAELVSQAKTLKEQLQGMRETLDVSKRLEEMETLKTIKSIHEEGRALGDLVDETEQMQREYKKFVADPTSFNRTSEEISWLGSALKNSKGNPNAVKSYANIMSDVKRLNFLGKANKESENKIINGTNQDDDGKITASNTFIMSQLLLDNEEREQKRRANNTNVMQGVLGNAGYSALGEESK